MNKLFTALVETLRKRDDTPMERLEYSKVKKTILGYCEQYLKTADDIFFFEALPSAIDATTEFLESESFLELYEFQHVSETCFAIRLHELNIL